VVDRSQQLYAFGPPTILEPAYLSEQHSVEPIHVSRAVAAVNQGEVALRVKGMHFEQDHPDLGFEIKPLPVLVDGKQRT
jgi:hypothetical protein